MPTGLSAGEMLPNNFVRDRIQGARFAVDPFVILRSARKHSRASSSCPLGDTPASHLSCASVPRRHLRAHGNSDRSRVILVWLSVKVRDLGDLTLRRQPDAVLSGCSFLASGRQLNGALRPGFPLAGGLHLATAAGRLGLRPISLEGRVGPLWTVARRAGPREEPFQLPTEPRDLEQPDLPQLRLQQAPCPKRRSGPGSPIRGGPRRPRVGAHRGCAGDA